LADVLAILLKVSLLLFMVGNLFDMGLRLEWSAALRGLRDVRFVVLILLWGFVVCPALAWGLTRIIPMDPAYGAGVILVAMAPCAPYMPLVVEKARGDAGYAATLMLLTAIGTVLFMPVAVPLMVKGLTASAWTIAKPLLFFILAPLAVGAALRLASTPIAERLHPFVKVPTSVATLVLIVVVFVIYGRDFLDARGSYTLLAEALFLVITGIATWNLGTGLKPNQKSVLILGLLSRNIGPASAPLFAAAEVDHRTLIAVLLALPTTIAASFAVAFWLGSRAAAAEASRSER
jgi:BASS family bile acid:Na+ symporter